MASGIQVRPASGTWSVRAGGAVLVESDRALALEEAGAEPVIFFPREDVAMAFLDESETVGTADGIGDPRYFSIVTKSTTIHDAARSYAEPSAEAEELRGYLAFQDSDQVTVEEI